MPLAMKFFLSMEQTGGQVEIHLQARVSEYLSLIMTLIIGFGIMFQLPVVLTLLAQAGIVSAQNLKDFRRYAIVAITAAAGILSPPDPFSMIAMALPTILLYEAAIYAVARVEKARAARAAAAQAPSRLGRASALTQRTSNPQPLVCAASTASSAQGDPGHVSWPSAAGAAWSVDLASACRDRGRLHRSHDARGVERASRTP